MRLPRFLRRTDSEPQPALRVDSRQEFRSSPASDALADRILEIAGAHTAAWDKNGELSIPIPDGPHDVHISELTISLTNKSGARGLAVKYTTATRVVFEKA
jgi:hypothetical protein